jgi:hypothetical protein
VGELADDAGVESVGQILTDSSMLIDLVRRQMDDVQPDLERMEEAVPSREKSMTDEEKKLFQEDRENLYDGLADLKQQFEQVQAELNTLSNGLSNETTKVTYDKTIIWLTDLLRLVQGTMLVQARARLETVSVETITLDSQEAFALALANRMDFMNGKAALVDSWRSIQINADALQSALNVTVNGDIRTTRNNPVSFRETAGNLQMGVEFDAPFTRLLERNNYRQSLIDYQRDRRNLIRSHDSLHLGLRGLLRQIELLRMDLEIQRRAVTIAIRRVDMTRAAFYAPVRPPQPGQRPAQFGPTAATNLLTALSALRNTQNNFMGVWLNYYAARMRLDRELGTMRLDENGNWIDHPISNSSFAKAPEGNRSSPPPTIPGEWIELADRLSHDPVTSTKTEVETSGNPEEVDTELKKEANHAK